MKRVNSFFVIMLLLAISAGTAATKYQTIQQEYWSNVFKGEKITPLFYGSTIHFPKSVWVKNTKGKDYVDFYSSGFDLFPEAILPTMKAEISLPDIESDKSKNFSVGLGLAGAGKITDADLDLLINSKLECTIKQKRAYLHFIPKQEAIRCLKRYPNIYDAYQKELAEGEELYIVLKAVYVEGCEIEINSLKETDNKISIKLASLLKDAHVQYKTTEKGKITIASDNKYVAVGLRQLVGGTIVSTGIGGLFENEVNSDIEFPNFRDASSFIK